MPATKVLLRALLPLFTIPFVPGPVAALAVLFFQLTTAHARPEDSYKLNHTTCNIYPYDNDTNSVDRARPNKDMGLAAVCLHPLFYADSPECLASVVYGSTAAAWVTSSTSTAPCARSRRVHQVGLRRILRSRSHFGFGIQPPSFHPSPLHPSPNRASPRSSHGGTSGASICLWQTLPPRQRPAATSATSSSRTWRLQGGILHPLPRHETYCTEFPEEAIAAAVWEHRRLNYRYTVGSMYASYHSKYKDEL